MIRTYHPKITAKLTKNISFDSGAAERYPKLRRTIDLTKWLGENGEVVTHKTIDANNPIGTFTIVLTDKMDIDTQDSVYALAAPMDLMEIRMARDSYKYTGDLPIIMRGFVTDVRRSETMSDDGKPSRSVIISGMDYTKIFYNIQILLFKYGLIGKLDAVGFNFSVKFGENRVITSVKKFYTIIMDKLVLKYLDNLFAGRGLSGAHMGSDLLVEEGVVLLTKINPDHHSVWNLMKEQADLPWNELYIEDVDNEENLPVLVHRKKPYKDPYTRNYILKGAKAEEITIDAIDIKSMNVSRTDANVANFIWVNSPFLYMMKSTQLQVSEAKNSPKTIYFQNVPNSDPGLYGDRLMNEVSNLSNGISAYNNLPEAKQKEAEKDLIQWIRKRRIELFNLNKDNVVHETGTMTIKGNENIRPGMYLRVNRGNLTAEYYIKAVTQKFLPFRAFTTELEFIRGTGFVERTQSGKGVYLSEIGRSV